jgi:hypothetical protein
MRVFLAGTCGTTAAPSAGSASGRRICKGVKKPSDVRFTDSSGLAPNSQAWLDYSQPRVDRIISGEGWRVVRAHPDCRYRRHRCGRREARLSTTAMTSATGFIGLKEPFVEPVLGEGESAADILRARRRRRLEAAGEGLCGGATDTLDGSSVSECIARGHRLGALQRQEPASLTSPHKLAFMIPRQTTPPGGGGCRGGNGPPWRRARGRGEGAPGRQRRADADSYR